MFQTTHFDFGYQGLNYILFTELTRKVAYISDTKQVVYRQLWKDVTAGFQFISMAEQNLP